LKVDASIHCDEVDYYFDKREPRPRNRAVPVAPTSAAPADGGLDGCSPYWKGCLKLWLITCPVQMMPATSENEKVRFHTFNRETQNRVVSHYVDTVTGKQVKDEDEVKGYQRGEDEYVMLEDEELENVTLFFAIYFL
jgi:hypothetical protein